MSIHFVPTYTSFLVPLTLSETGSPTHTLSLKEVIKERRRVRQTKLLLLLTLFLERSLSGT